MQIAIKYEFGIVTPSVITHQYRTTLDLFALISFYAVSFRMNKLNMIYNLLLNIF